MHPLIRLAVALALLTAGLRAVPTEAEPQSLQVFGYFQNAFMYQTRYRVFDFVSPERKSFSVQQHNLFFQKDLDLRWRAFVNYEMLNSFHSARRWGSANLEEAWVRYRWDARFNLKLGLSIPVFNNLNEIKNRTPLLPYIVRPLVYETSFSEFIAVEEYLPARAYVQAYGFVPCADVKLDYALFLGNGPNINDNPEAGQTGVDTTTASLIGGRLGLRRGELKLGASVSRDHLNAPVPLVGPSGKTRRFEQITRRRLGADLSFLWRDLTFEAEVIIVGYDDDVSGVAFDKEFGYATLGYRFGERLDLYASYWRTAEDFVQPQPVGPAMAGVQRVKVPTVGLAYEARENIVVKAQFAPIDLEGEGHDVGAPQVKHRYEAEFRHVATSVSVVF